MAIRVIRAVLSVPTPPKGSFSSPEGVRTRSGIFILIRTDANFGESQNGTFGEGIPGKKTAKPPGVQEKSPQKPERWRPLRKPARLKSGPQREESGHGSVPPSRLGPDRLPVGLEEHRRERAGAHI
jgi:hypothetical protein